MASPLQNIFDLPKLTISGLDPLQEQGFRFMLSARRCINAMRMGDGKALSLDAKILTPTGWVLMQDIHIGDLVIGKDGKAKKVFGVFPQGEKDLFRAMFSDGSSIECCDDHLWYVATFNNRYDDSTRDTSPFTSKKMKRRVRPLKTFRHNLKDRYGNRKYFIPMVEPVEFNIKATLPLDPYLLGVLLGDGSISRTSNFSSADSEIVESVSAAVSHTSLTVKFKSKYDYAISGNSRKPGANVITNALRALGVFGKHSWDKLIPEIYKKASIQDRISILQGLLDTDGEVDVGSSEIASTISFTSTSKQLALDVQFLVWSLGGKATCAERTTKYTDKNGVRVPGRLSYRLHISLSKNITPFRLSRKANCYTPPSKYPPSRAFESVEFSRRAEAQCISVEDGFFVTDDFIVTHNTLTTLAAIDARSLYPAIILCKPSVTLKMASEVLYWLDGVRGPKRTVSVLEGETHRRQRIAQTYVRGVGQMPVPINDLSCEIIICGYSISWFWAEDLALLKPKSLVIDEAHHVSTDGSGDPAKQKSGISKRHRAATYLARSVQPVDYLQHIYQLTASPMRNGRPRDLIGLIHILGRLQEFGGWRGFSRSYCSLRLETIKIRGGYTRQVWNNKGASNQQELHARLQAFYMFRPPKEESEHKLTRDFIPVEISNQAEYQRAERDFVLWIKQKAEQDQEFLTWLNSRSMYELQDKLMSQTPAGLGWGIDKLTNFLRDKTPDQQIQAAKKLLRDNYIQQAENKARRHQASIKLWALWELAGRGKITSAIERIESFLEDSDGKLIVFAHHRAVQDGLRQAFPKSPEIVSGQKPEDRDRNIWRFQNGTDPDDRIIRVSTMAGGEGLDLTAAYTALHVELPQTGEVLKQAEGRAFNRRNDPHGLESLLLLGINTIDQYLLASLDTKITQASAVIDGQAENIGADLSEDSILNRLLSRYSDGAWLTGE